MRISDLKPRRVLVVGLGRSGVAAARLAARGGAAVAVTDLRTTEELASTLSELPDDTDVFCNGHPDACLDGVDLVVTSPGVAADAAIHTAAQERGISVFSEVEFAWTHCPEAPLAAVTGSNGKSTVTALLHEMLVAAGLRSVAGGNLGPPASELVLTGSWDLWVLEISSFQAEMLTAMRPRVAVFLNLSQDHLERHRSIDGYLSAKRRIFSFQEEADVAVLNADDPVSATTATRARRLFFSTETDADAHLEQGRLVVHDDEYMDSQLLAMSGLHNVSNALAASLAARQLGADKGAIVRTLASFEGLPHRHRTILHEAGVRWVDDSKATNVGSAVAALRGYRSRSVHLILGGQAKGQIFTPMREEVRRAASRVYFIGVDGERIASALGDVAATESCGTLAEAVRRARSRARAGDTVLLAPACASFDQFTGYAERGDAFAACVQGVPACP